MRRFSLSLGMLLVTAVLARATPASATPDFPSVVQQFVGAAAPPPCTICHNNPNGGLGTVTTPFGTYLRSRGLVAADESSLRQALEAARAEHHDSNGDGVPDIDALHDGVDPNAAPSAGDALAPPQYGCGAEVAPSRPGVEHPGVLVVSLALVGVLGWRRRKRSATSAQLDRARN